MVGVMSVQFEKRKCELTCFSDILLIRFTRLTIISGCFCALTNEVKKAVGIYVL